MNQKLRNVNIKFIDEAYQIVMNANGKNQYQKNSLLWLKVTERS